MLFFVDPLHLKVASNKVLNDECTIERTLGDNSIFLGIGSPPMVTKEWVLMS